MVGDEGEDGVVGDEGEDGVVGDEAEDVVLGDETEDVVHVASSEYWDVNVINEDGYVSKTRLCVKDLVANSEFYGTWIILEWVKSHRAVGSAARLLAEYLGTLVRMYKDFPMMFESWKAIPMDKKIKFYDTKIKRHFVVDDARDKDYILASAGKKWKDRRHHLFHKFYKWDLTLEENLKHYPKCQGITENDWTLFVQYRRKEKTQRIATKNTQNRGKLKIPHTLGSKSLARKQHELEKLQAAIKDSVSENEAFQKVFGKEHLGYVRSMGLGVTPSQINRSTTSLEENEKIKEMQEEINALKEKNSKIDELMKAVAFLKQRDNAMTEEIERLRQMQNSSGRQRLESPADGRRSSESSYRIADNGSSRRTN
ncbi:uncharacterized protein LOC131613954 [Vicia villosa]|uniref:uncharacterized protein LOC131613954 n=1 Tax=Vicia villosa TaxID=3911 RepID=UPI00273AE971|nr:uncharacterized protein LOC131613954 [Vicia villosa]